MNTGNAAMRNVVAPPKPPNLVSTSERIDSSVAYGGVVDVSEQEGEKVHVKIVVISRFTLTLQWC